jgi:hypothetical protein
MPVVTKLLPCFLLPPVAASTESEEKGMREAQESSPGPDSGTDNDEDGTSMDGTECEEECELPW